MKKKIIKKIHKKKQVSSLQVISKRFLYFTIFFAAFSIILTGILAFTPHAQIPPCANSITCVKDLSGRISKNTNGTFMGKKVVAPNVDYFAQTNQLTHVLGAQTSTGPQHIFIDLAAQHLYAFQGSQLVYSFPISSGKWYLTPTGTFQTWIKLTATLMAGGEGATSYYLPNVPWTMYFANAKIPRSDGYALHGEYWFNPDTGLGQPQSHGCINMRISDAKLLYDWANPPTSGYTTHTSATNPGTLVTIYGATPNRYLIGTRFYNNNTSFNAGTVL